MARGVLPSMLVTLWVLSFLVLLRYPLQVLPMQLLELVWKTIWLIAFGLPQWIGPLGLTCYKLLREPPPKAIATS